MKKFILLLFALNLGTLHMFGQNKGSTSIAVFNGDQTSLDKEINSKTVSFTIINQDENSRNNFEKNIGMYSNSFMIYYPTIRESKTSQVYILTLINKAEIKMLRRLFISSNIKEIQFDGNTMNLELFFKPYMK
ncbi:MAG: hypothetical protein H0W84_14775 [Bacteroidetes bacterium]|nr:hypothetical protein [Bacteroidota bacterium]